VSAKVSRVSVKVSEVSAKVRGRVSGKSAHKTWGGHAKPERFKCFRPITQTSFIPVAIQPAIAHANSLLINSN
jgi:hypothetical protein